MCACVHVRLRVYVFVRKRHVFAYVCIFTQAADSVDVLVASLYGRVKESRGNKAAHFV
jgi:hypothetical protein